MRGMIGLAVSVACLTTFGIDKSVAAPAQLYGKSVIVTWSEDRVQKSGLRDTPSYVSRNGEFSVYVSSAGRAFNRMTYAGTRSAGGGGVGHGRSGRHASGSSDQVGGEGQGISRSVSFSGRTMSTTTPMDGGARRILVTFDGDFSGCNAQVLTGKAAGVAKIRSTSSMNAGMPLEIESVKSGRASCKVQNGNIFGN
jgi:hypothetical protein